MAVTALGAICRIEIPLRSLRGIVRRRLTEDSSDGPGFAKTRNHRFPRYRPLPQRNPRHRSCGQIYVHTAAKADQADALPRRNDITGFDERYNTPRHQPRYLRETDTQTVVALHDNMLPLIIFARLVEIGVDELPRYINDRFDGSGNRRAIDVDIEHAHEDRHAHHGCIADAVCRPRNLAWRLDFLYQGDQAIGGCDEKVGIIGRNAHRVAKKGEHPQRYTDQKPPQYSPAKEKHQQSDSGGYGAKFPPLGMNVRKPPFHAGLRSGGCRLRTIGLSGVRRIRVRFHRSCLVTDYCKDNALRHRLNAKSSGTGIAS